MTQPAPIDQFRRALAGAARAIAQDPEVEVVFASEVAPASGKTARVVLPGPSLEPRLVAEARGAADSLALRLRHHDAKLHATHVPMDLEARAVFDALETARVEALGSRHDEPQHRAEEGVHARMVRPNFAFRRHEGFRHP